MKTATLCFLIRGNEVCLGFKKRGFGMNKFAGFGGKVGDKEEFNGETIEESITREGQEEFGIEVVNLVKMAELVFNFPEDISGGMLVHVFICREWKSEPRESEEMRPEWFGISQIPYDQMWQDNAHWLPVILTGKKIRGHYDLKKDGTITSQRVETL
jgi:NADH pyrophosphatase NudC (nudix superfamily)